MKKLKKKYFRDGGDPHKSKQKQTQFVAPKLLEPDKIAPIKPARAQIEERFNQPDAPIIKLAREKIKRGEQITTEELSKMTVARLRVGVADTPGEFIKSFMPEFENPAEKAIENLPPAMKERMEKSMSSSLNEPLKEVENETLYFTSQKLNGQKPYSILVSGVMKSATGELDYGLKGTFNSEEATYESLKKDTMKDIQRLSSAKSDLDFHLQAIQADLQYAACLLEPSEFKKIYNEVSETANSGIKNGSLISVLKEGDYLSLKTQSKVVYAYRPSELK
jgi:hypothetical protein